MRILKLILFIPVFGSSSGFGQTSGSDYILADCEHSLVIADLFWHDTVTSRQISSPFILKDHLSWLAPTFPYPTENWTLEDMKAESRLICLTKEQLDSILALEDIVYQYPVFGYLDEDYFECSVKTAGKYGFRPTAMGCRDNGEYDGYVRMIDRILELRNGDAWKTKQEAEIEECLYRKQ